MLNGKQRDVVEGDEHAAVDEEDGQAEGDEAPFQDGLADALLVVLFLRGLDLVIRASRGIVFALLDEKARDEQDGDGDEGDDAVHPGGVHDGKEPVDDDGPEDAADGGAREGDAQGEAALVVEPFGDGAGGWVEAMGETAC